VKSSVQVFDEIVTNFPIFFHHQAIATWIETSLMIPDLDFAFPWIYLLKSEVQLDSTYLVRGDFERHSEQLWKQVPSSIQREGNA
jgi:hypothetical protein